MNSDSKKEVIVLGNSVAMRVRPVKDMPGNLNYSMLLKQKGYQVTNLSTGGSTICNAVAKLDSLIRTFPDYFILNFGVVDSSTREIPRWFFNLRNSPSQKWYNQIVRWLYSAFIKRLRRFLVIIRFKTPWVRKKVFRKNFHYLLENLIKETNARIIIMPINIANARVESELPGSRKNHIEYNMIMKEAMKSDRCVFLDLEDLEPERHYPDGVHYSSDGHKLVASRIDEIMNNN